MGLVWSDWGIPDRKKSHKAFRGCCSQRLQQKVMGIILCGDGMVVTCNTESDLGLTKISFKFNDDGSRSTSLLEGHLCCSNQVRMDYCQSMSTLMEVKLMSHWQPGMHVPRYLSIWLDLVLDLGKVLSWAEIDIQNGHSFWGPRNFPTVARTN